MQRILVDLTALFGILSAYFWFRSAWLSYYRLTWRWKRRERRLNPDAKTLDIPEPVISPAAARKIAFANAVAAVCAGIASLLGAVSAMI